GPALPGPARPGLAHLGRERARALEPEDADLMAARGLAAHLRQEVDLRAADVERRDDVQDPHATSPYTARTPSTMRSAVHRASIPSRPRRPIARRSSGESASIARTASASAPPVTAPARKPVFPCSTMSRAPSTGVATTGRAAAMLSSAM